MSGPRRARRSPSAFGPESCKAPAAALVARTTTQWSWYWGPTSPATSTRPENKSALEPELQAEVQFGWENGEGQDTSTVLDNVRTFLEHGADWREGGEPLVVEFREEAEKSEPPGATALGESAALEVQAWQLAVSEDWIAASQRLEDAARVVGKGAEAHTGTAVSCCTSLLFGSTSVPREKLIERTTRQLHPRRRAGVATRHVDQGDEGPARSRRVELDAADGAAINEIVARLTGQFKPNKVQADLEKMRSGLDQESSGLYEQALTALGTFLGAMASKPPGQGRCDSAWCWGNFTWLTIEAKSEEHSDGLLPLKDIRQATPNSINSPQIRASTTRRPEVRRSWCPTA